MSRTQLGFVGGAMMFVAPILAGHTWGAGVAHAQEMSEGCGEVNDDAWDGFYGGGGTGGPMAFHAGEVVVAQATEPSTTTSGDPGYIGILVEVSGSEEGTTDDFPGTVSYVIPADGDYHVQWSHILSFVTWTVSCTAPPPPPDEDGDSVPDSADLCPGTVPDSPTEGLRGARFALTGTTFDSGMDQFDGMYTIADTAGCSGAQIVELRGLGAGHLKHGISKGALEAFIASL